MADDNKENDDNSMYFNTLDGISKDRYKSKLMVDGISLPDPYRKNLKGWNESVKCWPVVEYVDIVGYLIDTPGQYTREKMRAVKSLDGYNFFISGHVQTCFCNRMSEDVPVCFIKAKVAPSQRANDKPHEPWVCLNKEKGYVVAAHCTCKAGLGEACSHIGALLFKVEAVGRFNLRNESKTSEACSWNRSFRKKVTAQRVVDIDFTKPKYGKKPKRKVNQRKPVAVEGTSSEDQKRALEELRRICPTAGCLFKGESDTDTASEDEDLPPLLSCYRDHDPNECTEEELGRRCADFVKDFTVTEIQCENLEKMTRSQSQSMLWQRHREGRITATIAHDVKTLRLKTSREQVLNKILKVKQTNLSKVEAVAFGRKYEKEAKNMYCTQMNKVHEQFKVSDCGLVVDKQLSMFAATPDGLRSCACHGDGLLEIKCSYKHKEVSVVDIPDMDSGFYLEKGTLQLKRSHRYFTQIQFQMHVCKKAFCDFVVFTHRGIYVQTIQYDPEFVEELVLKCTVFALDELVPVIVRQKFIN